MKGAVLGIDVGKRKCQVVLLAAGKCRHKSHSNSPEGYAQLSSWLARQGVSHVHACLEATGPYGDAVALYLHEAGHTVSVVNPARELQALGRRLEALQEMHLQESNRLKAVGKIPSVVA